MFDNFNTCDFNLDLYNNNFIFIMFLNNYCVTSSFHNFCIIKQNI